MSADKQLDLDESFQTWLKCCYPKGVSLVQLQELRMCWFSSAAVLGCALKNIPQGWTDDQIGDYYNGLMQQIKNFYNTRAEAVRASKTN